MKIETLVVGPLETNCYILTNDEEVVIVDPGDEFNKIKEAIGRKKVVGCLVTHFHQDHIEALEEVLSKYEVDVNKVNSSKFKFTAIETPGHTFDSRTFYFEDEKIMFTGDFIFNNAIGRVDLGGNINDMVSSLKMISSYPDNITIYPGHGPKTTLGQEKEHFSQCY